MFKHVHTSLQRGAEILFSPLADVALGQNQVRVAADEHRGVPEDDRHLRHQCLETKAARVSSGFTEGGKEVGRRLCRLGSEAQLKQRRRD